MGHCRVKQCGSSAATALCCPLLEEWRGQTSSKVIDVWTPVYLACLTSLGLTLCHKWINTFWLVVGVLWEGTHLPWVISSSSHFHLQGYSRDTSFLEMVVDIIQELKKANPSLVYGQDISFFSLFTFQILRTNTGQLTWSVDGQKTSNYIFW